MKRIISIIVLTAMFTAIAVGLAGCGVKTTLRSGNDPIIGKWKCNEAYDENFDWLGRVYYGLDIDASGWGIFCQSAYQRQKILKALIDEGKCTKHDVISYLQNRVSLNSNRQGFNSALTKWKADISYVKQL